MAATTAGQKPHGGAARSLGTTFYGPSCPAERGTVVYHIKPNRQREIVKMAVEGCSIRSIERITDSHRDTVMRHLVRVGQHCQQLHDEHVRGVSCQYAQCDEIWCVMAKKQRRVMPGDPGEYGDTYTFVGMDQDSKLVVSFLVGKRDEGHTYKFMQDMSSRIIGHVQISTDGWGCYPSAVMDSFNGRSSYAQVLKSYGGTTTDGAHRYSPPRLSHVRRYAMWGRPRMRYISTSHVERQNLTMRMQMRRFTRLTNGFSKKLENLRAAVALHFMWYNFVRRHSAHSLTPAVAAGITNRQWSIDRLLPEW